MTNLILPRRKLIVPAMAAGLAAASPAMGHNGGPPITDGEVRAAIQDVRRAGIELPWGVLPSDATLAMFMMAKMTGMMVGGDGGPPGLRPQDVFATTLYAGNGGSQSVTTGLNINTTGGLSWFKSRFSSRNHALVTNVKYDHFLSSNNDSPLTNGFNELLTFNSVGFTLSTPFYWLFNGNSEQYVNWTFLRAPKFFDFVTWTGTGTLSRVINHALEIPPGLIIIKRTDAPGNWLVYHRSLGAYSANASYNLLLNSDAVRSSSAYIFTDSLTETSFTLYDGNVNTNINGASYVAYVFAHDPGPSGIVQCGSFIPSGGESGLVNLGWRPQFVMTKSVTSVLPWEMYDAARGVGSGTTAPTTPNSAKLLANSISTEESDNYRMAFSPTGFSHFNGSGSNSQIYLAIREPIL